MGKQERREASAPWCRLVGTVACAWLLCAAAFVALLLLVQLIPTASMSKGLSESAAQLTAEGQYPRIDPNDKTSQADNFTTAIMLGVTGFRSDDPVRSALLGERYTVEADSQVERLSAWVAAGFDDGGNVGSYARYWHGYQVFLAPLLCFLNIAQIRQVLLFAIAALAVALALLVARRCGAALGLALVLPLACFNMEAVGLSPSFAPAFIVALAAGSLAAVFYDRAGGVRGSSGQFQPSL